MSLARSIIQKWRKKLETAQAVRRENLASVRGVATLNKQSRTRRRNHAEEAKRLAFTQPRLAKLKTRLGEGVELKKKEKLLSLEIPDSYRCAGAWVFGSTRSGKSRLLEQIAISDIRKGYSTVIFDPKGDPELFNAIAYWALKTGRKDDLMLVTPIFPDLSAVIDPLASYYMIEELVAHITAGVSVGDDPYYYNVAYEMALGITTGLITLAVANHRQPVFNLKEVENYVSYNGLTKLRDQLASLDPTKDIENLVQMLNRILSTPPDFFAKVGSSLRVALSELTNGHVGRIIGKADENRFLKRLEEGKTVIMVVQLGALLTARAAQTTAKVILSMIQSYIGRVLASGGKIHPPLTLHIDEAQSCIHSGFPDMIAQVGSSNTFITAYNQSINQLTDVLGHEKTYSILDNANTKIFFRVPDSETADYVSRHLGERKILSPILSFGGGFSVRETEDLMVKTSDVLSLAPREFYLMTFGGVYRGKTYDVPHCPLAVQFPTPNTIRKIR
ncbi:type IV secretory system conjugative DNA transfer family protein [Geoalkalibacter sp.]|uniref:type IV secretory system conjugative DNA transfer family protein n=1 Tax=Geoalkalibacter sp. TaxID=3041440 RepID=UPI00272E2F4B|nr:TraM recognition domain-containing protein [Geoalkalibacter sp.]